MELYAGAFVVGLLTSGFVGMAIGKARGREVGGFILGVLFGPLGWLFILVSSDERLRCPQCKGLAPLGAKVCMHCGVRFL